MAAGRATLIALWASVAWTQPEEPLLSGPACWGPRGGRCGQAECKKLEESDLEFNASIRTCQVCANLNSTFKAGSTMAECEGCTNYTEFLEAACKIAGLSNCTEQDLMEANSTYCLSMALSQAEPNSPVIGFFTLEACKSISPGERHLQSWMCHPFCFWNFYALPLLVSFLVLIVYRRMSLRKASQWREREEPHSPAATLHKSSVKDSKTESLLPLDSTTQPVKEQSCKKRCRDCCRKVGHFVISLPKTLCRLSWKTVLTIVLQVAQWWVLMLIVLVVFTCNDIYQAGKAYGITEDVLFLRDKPACLLKNMKHEWLAIGSIYSAVALLLLYVVSLVNILMQFLGHSVDALRYDGCLSLCKYGSLMVFGPRDVAIQVHLLPMVYGYLAFKSVVCMWESITFTWQPPLQCAYSKKLPLYSTTTVSDRRRIQQDVFECNFALADIYEAWTLYCFGVMLTEVLHPDLKKKIKVEVIQAFDGLLLVDLRVFIGVCFIQAIVQITKTWCSWRFGFELENQIPALATIVPYFVGASWVVSSVAIYNLLAMEYKFHRLPRMISFEPSLKFWSIKIMVLVSFWSSLLMGVITSQLGFSAEEGYLIDATLRIYVMFFVSLINFQAWYPWSTWFREIVEDSRKFTTTTPEFDDVGLKTKPPPGTISLVGALFRRVRGDETSPKSDEDDEWAEDWANVENEIENLNDDDVIHILYMGSQYGWMTSVIDIKEHHNSRAFARGSWFFHTGNELRPRKTLLMLEMTPDRRKTALKAHLRSFYPED